MRSLVAVLAALGLAVAQNPPQPGCQFTPPNLTPTAVSYDLSNLWTGGNAITVADSRDQDDLFEYAFAICSDINVIPQMAICASTRGQIGPNQNQHSGFTSGPSPAFQYLKSAVGSGPDQCWRLAGSWGMPANHVISNLWGAGAAQSPVNTNASGVTLSLINGDYCWDNITQAAYPRQLHVHFICDTNSQPIATMTDLLVEETSTCVYEMILHHARGCPLQCQGQGGLYGNALCSGQGRCGWDQSGEKAKCFCNTGFSGQQCQVTGDLGSPKPTGHPGWIVLGLVGGIFVGAGAAGGLLYYFVYGGGSSGVSPFSGAAPSFGGRVTSMFGGSRKTGGEYISPPTSGGIPGISDGTDSYVPPRGGGIDDADNPML